LRAEIVFFTSVPLVSNIKPVLISKEATNTREKKKIATGLGTIQELVGMK
jgi:hypothetical protein